MDSYSAQRASSFVGIARIDLDHISFGDALNPNENHRSKSEKSIARMLSIFRLEGCMRGEDRNFIEGLISDEHLEAALLTTGVTKESLKAQSQLPLRHVDDVIKLRLEGPIQCNDGLHRVLAARRFLDNNDRWWIVKLFRKEEYPQYAKQRVYESYAHEESYTDGTIFRNIRIYSRAGNQLEENKWWARLTEGKKKDLRQLISSNKYSDMCCESGTGSAESIIRVFDELLDLAGLWPPLQLGTLHRLHGLRCREELMSYLLYVKQIWMSIAPRHCWKHVDEVTVSELELLAPAISSRDHDCVKKLMQNQKIFNTIKDPEVRADILQNILSQKRLIPSLRTFFEDQKYLEPCSNILKTLLDDDERRPLWRAFKANYWPVSSVQVQMSECTSSLDTLEVSPIIDKDLGMKLGYLQLWLFCMRHFPELTTIKPRIESRRKKRIWRQYNVARLQQLGSLAVTLGFRTPKALNLAFQSADWTEALYQKMMLPTSLLTHTLPFTSNEYWPRDRRSGRPYDEDHDNDQSALFPSMLYCKIEPGYDITPLYVKRNMLEAFLGPFIPQIQQDMKKLLDLRLSQPSVPRPRTSEQQDGLRSRDNELARLKLELEASHKKIVDCEAMSVQQFALFQLELVTKTDRLSELERQLAESQKLHETHDTQLVRTLETLIEKLQAKVSSQQEYIAQIVADREVHMQEKELLRKKLATSAEEQEALLAQIDSSDVFGGNYENSNLGAPPNEDDTTCQALREAIDGKETHIKSLQEVVQGKDAVIEDLQARAKLVDITVSSLERTKAADEVALKELKEATEQKGAMIKQLEVAKEETMQRLREIIANRHIALVYDLLNDVKHIRELDVEKIFQIGAQNQWHTDIATILGSRPVLPHFIHVTILDVDADTGVRSVLTKVPIEKERTIGALLHCLRRSDRNYGLYLTWFDKSKNSVMSRIMTHQPDDVKGFIEVCQQPDTRIFFGHYEHFLQFFEPYRLALLQGQLLSSNKRAGGSLESTGKRAAPTLPAQLEAVAPDTPSDSEYL